MSSCRYKRVVPDYRYKISNLNQGMIIQYLKTSRINSGIYINLMIKICITMHHGSQGFIPVFPTTRLDTYTPAKCIHSFAFDKIQEWCFLDSCFCFDQKLIGINWRTDKSQ